MLTRFEEGDKVWIERTDYVENVDLIRKVQTVDYAIDVPTDEPDSQAIYIVGSDFIYSNEDLKHDRKTINTSRDRQTTRETRQV